MSLDTLTSVSFDKQDLDLFRVDDKDIKARAIRNSVIPRLLDVLHSAIAEIREVYAVEPLEWASISFSPNRLKSRGKGGTFSYDVTAAHVGLIPKVGSTASSAMSKCRRYGELPMGLYILLKESGIGVVFSVESKRRNSKVIELARNFLIENENVFLPLINLMHGSVNVWTDHHPKALISPFPLKESLRGESSSMSWELGLLSRWLRKIPITDCEMRAVGRTVVALYPLFHALAALAHGKTCDVIEMVNKICRHSQERYERMCGQSAGEAKSGQLDMDLASELSSVVEKRVPVRIGVRWQVFERDGWKCVACGKTAEEGARLEVDHIVPRSKGGRDELSNYQTLCKECNIGKSNRNQTDLRTRCHDRTVK